MKKTLCFIVSMGAFLLMGAEEIIFMRNFDKAEQVKPYMKSGAVFAQPEEALNDGKGAIKFHADDFMTKTARIVLPLDKIRGKAIQLEADMRAVDLKKSTPEWLGPKLMLHWVSPHGVGHAEQPKIWGSHDWKHFSIYMRIPRNATGAFIILGLQKGKGTIYIRNVKIIAVPDDGFKGLPPHKGRKKEFKTQYRGMMTPFLLKEQDVIDFAEKFNGNLFRYQMTRGQSDLTTEAQYNVWLDEHIRNIDKLMPLFRKYGIKIVLDVHTGPGMPQDKLLRNIIRWEPEVQDILVRAWEKLARHFKGNPVIYGYDLLNEPREDNYIYRPGNGLDWNRLAARIATAIRKIDPETPIIIEPFLWASPSALSCFSPVDLPNIIYSIHFYQPATYSHQAQGKYPSGTFNKEWLRKQLQVAREFQLTYNVPIFVGEFSCIRWADGAADYLRDCISIFEEYGWDWTYHAFREYTGWSVEHDGPRTAPEKVEHTDRMQVLLDFYKNNKRSVLK